jgi:hypothetical protein
LDGGQLQIVFPGTANWFRNSLETPGLPRIDAPLDCLYIQIMRARKVQVGQVWKQDGNGESYLVTKVYNEALASFAVLRKAGNETEPPIRIKVARNGAGQSLPGYTYAQESDDF